jgi:hypothetical protein
MKHHFQILQLAPEYTLYMQVQIPAALCAIHNFIHEHDTPPDPWLSTTPSRHGSPEYDGDDMNPQVHAGTEGNNNRQDEIVMVMWEDYQARHMEMGLDEEETDDSGDGDDDDNNNNDDTTSYFPLALALLPISYVSHCMRNQY